MIPKKIHYCWLGGGKMSENIISAIESWKRTMPDYELILWNESKFDINSVPWVTEACRKRKWSLATDYIRLYAVYTEGGIYLDTDVYVLKRFDDFLAYDYFTSLEYENDTTIFENVINSNLDDIQRVGDVSFQSGIFGGIKGHPFLKDCMSWFERHHFILPDGTLYENIIAPHIYAAIAQKYGFRYINQAQKLQNQMMIFPSSVFTQGNFNITKESYAVHWWDGSWRQDKSLMGKIARNNVVRKLLGKEPIPRKEPIPKIDNHIQECMKRLNQENSI
jgi:mannosyltransferase OCH1-like enzyme